MPTHIPADTYQRYEIAKDRWECHPLYRVEMVVLAPDQYALRYLHLQVKEYLLPETENGNWQSIYLTSQIVAGPAGAYEMAAKILHMWRDHHLSCILDAPQAALELP